MNRKDVIKNYDNIFYLIYINTLTTDKKCVII